MPVILLLKLTIYNMVLSKASGVARGGYTGVMSPPEIFEKFRKNHISQRRYKLIHYLSNIFLIFCTILCLIRQLLSILMEFL